ncbi:hypothetical protein M436DRAFT_49036 [Aureobasidium namibiae CBS 147.97]|uniref:Trafficking protein particle complex subunit 11 domain-containing protein n=1 Tax=Aureobasidium namibiae CBS 147.97 TaxID=1043004 RepID=A0A074WQG5_9PEZI|nr:uncharacterized protein M436DRAFT_49036 [Aureobasidium namibiae CBS 147.97]KEQ71952.1 hypothetical protein M436DRAFT_49036 [Aureobasidium namibiae CBS 147.97]
MEAYPEDYVAHNLPFIALAGLPAADSSTNAATTTSAQGSGLSISDNSPPLSGPHADSILDEFLRADGASLSWSDQALSDRAGLIGFKLSSVGRSFVFPSRKAAPPPIVPTQSPPTSPNPSSSTSHDLHSPLSPLSPSSPVFPDGLMTPLWLAKHQSRIPAVYLSFQTLDSDPSNDAALKNHINDTGNAIAKSGFKTRYAVVLVSDDAAISPLDFEERLANIRRATSLDPKISCFHFDVSDSQTDLPNFVSSVLRALQPVCIDYYRDLTKHSRRKRGRAAPPPITAAASRGTSQVLTMNGWNVRYDFKMAVFAEFRQEMDVAQRHYESALEELFGPEGSLEHTPSWSARWQEARLLCDIIAFRVLRCQIWRGMTSGAAESWYNYKERMRDLIDRRGKGTDNSYGWEAWEARWAKMMAQLIEMADLPVFKPVDLSDPEDQTAGPTIYAPAEKMYATLDRMMPFHLLHHPGYWWRLACKHLMARKRNAEAIPQEDRTLPSETTAAQLASRTRTYDTYMVPQPHEEAPLTDHSTYDYLLDLQSQTERVESIMSNRGQLRAVQQVKIDLAREFHKAERYDEVLQTIQPVWESMIWRREKWFDLAIEVLELIYDSAERTGNSKLQAESAWELAYQRKYPHPTLRSQKSIDILQCLSSAGSNDDPTHILLNTQSRFSQVSVTFSFLSGEGFVGDTAVCQVAVVFNGSARASNLTLHELRVQFNTNIRSLVLNHSDNAGPSLSTNLKVQEEHDAAHPMAKGLLTNANLTFKPGQLRVFNLTIPLRDPDSFVATGASLVLKASGATLEHVLGRPTDISSSNWWLLSEEKLLRKQIPRAEPNTIQVLPKPPKVQLRITNLREQYFVSEKVALEIQILNEEAEEVNAFIRAEGQDNSDVRLELAWKDNRNEAKDMDLTNLQIGKISVNEAKSHVLEFMAPLDLSEYTLRLEVNYRLASDSETPVMKTLESVIPFVSPFEANYDFGPRLHTGAYPNYFSLPDLSEDDKEQSKPARGMAQRWCLTSRVVSFSSEPLLVEATRLVVNKVTSNAICDVEESPKSQTASRSMSLKDMMDVPHILEVRKLTLEDRRPSALELSLAVTWRREGAGEHNTTTTMLAVPSMTIPSAEPRVLCTASVPANTEDEAITVSYTLENPSMHFLTFNLTMEANESFAFSGSKHRAVSLTPMSRLQVDYRLFVYAVEDDALTERHGQKGHWVWPALRVVDAYFHKTLRVLDAGDGVQSDDRGGVGIWIAR